jgi:hypothetical protein
MQLLPGLKHIDVQMYVGSGFIEGQASPNKSAHVVIFWN